MLCNQSWLHSRDTSTFPNRSNQPTNYCMTCGTPHSRIPLICVKTDKATSPAIFSCPTFCSQPIRTLHLNCRKTPMPDRSLLWIRCILYTYHLLFRATSHTRPRARDHHTSSALIGGKGGVGPSLLPSHHAWGTIEVISECKMDVKSTWIRTWHRMDHVPWSLGLSSITTSWRHAYHKIRRPRHFEGSQPLVYSIFYHVWGPA